MWTVNYTISLLCNTYYNILILHFILPCIENKTITLELNYSMFSNKKLKTTSTTETDDFEHYRFFKCRPHFLKIWKNYHICVFSRHIVDEKLNFFLEFFHQKNCMQKFLQFFSLRILRVKIREKFTEVSLDKTKFCDFFQIFPTISWGKRCKKRNLHNQR